MALELLAVDHRYGRRRSLQGVSLTVRPGDRYGFIGHNGAGKTTTLRIALGLDRPRRGRVQIDGFDAARFPREARARVGGTIESTRFYGWASARDNLLALARLQGMTRPDARREVDRVLDEVGLEAHADRRVRAFSQGMRQRLGLGQALLGRPRYVLLDEPQNGLDPEGVADLRAVLQRLTADGDRAVLVSSHQLLEVTELCNRIGVLREGRLLLEDDTDTLLTSTRGRYTLATDTPDATRAVLDRLDVTGTSADGDPRLVELELGDASPRTVVRELVTAGIGVEQLTPRPATLEEVYLRLRNGHAPTVPPTAETGPAAASRPATPGEPTPRLAPRRPAVRVWAHDLRRQSRRASVLLLLTLPAILAWRRIESLVDANARHLADVASGDLFSTSVVTGFEALGRALTAGLPVLTVLAAAFGSQAIAGDVTLGTLRNTLLRPVRRRDVALGKAAALATGLLTSLVLLVATAWLLAGMRFAFGDRTEVYRDSEPDLWIEAADVWPFVPETIASLALPVAAYAGLGLLIGTVVRRGIWALVTALASVVALDLGRAAVRPLGYEAWLPSAHQPSPLGDTSYLAFFVDVAIGNAEAFYEFGDKVWAVPATWAAVTFALATLLLARKRIP